MSGDRLRGCADCLVVAFVLIVMWLVVIVSVWELVR